LKLEKEIADQDKVFNDCRDKHCKKVNYLDDCMDLGEEKCRIKYKDLIENIKKTKKQQILPLADCM